MKEKHTIFDKTKLGNLTKLLESLKEEDEDFKTAITEKVTRQDNEEDRSCKKEFDYDDTPTSSYNGKYYHRDK